MKKLTQIMIILGICNYASANSDGQFGSQQIINSNASEANTVLAVDIDGDGDLDAISASSGDNTIAWYSNLDGEGFFGTPRKITTSANEVVDIFVADIDGDGDLDVVAATRGDDRIAWYENLYNESGGNFSNFGPAQTISTALDYVDSVYAADIDGDGDLDVLSSSNGNQRHKVAWYENTNGLGSFGGQQNLIPSNRRGAFSVKAGDLDGDGDLDIIYGTIDQVMWLRNTNGEGAFSSRITLAADIFGSKDIHLADIDNDGNLDVLFSSTWISGDRISVTWYKNTGNGDFIAQTPIDNTDIRGAWSVYPADLDKDGDLDVVAASFSDDTVVWYENIDGQSTFGSMQIISENTLEARSVYAADIDGDGDNDVLSASSGDNKIAWYKNNNVVIDLIFSNAFE
ncbi:MAG: VCBS repeat-containing protein [Xanthomonadales bacterium]|nr:VCBS repeat-containing protein [Xanthomonadales bacterium]